MAKGKALVVGAGVIGASCAFHLAKTGFSVDVAERHDAPGLETSKANGGQLSSCHARPWSQPGAISKGIAWLFQKDAPLLMRPSASWSHWSWLMSFALNCRESVSRSNMKKIMELGLYSRLAMSEIEEDLARAGHPIDYDRRSAGILHFYRDESEFKAGRDDAKLMSAWGLERSVLTKEEAFAIEPALRAGASEIIGATWTPSDASGDARKWAEGIVKGLCFGIPGFGAVRFLPGVCVALEQDGDRARARLEREEGGVKKILDESYALIVCAAASYTNGLLEPLGESLKMIPAKGYSATIPLLTEEQKRAAPIVSLTDDENKLVFSRLGDRLRVAGTAELSGFDLSLREERCEPLWRKTKALFPGLSEAHPEFWCGLRPLAPGNVPTIQRSAKAKNVLICSGHGSLGWTLGAGSGKLLARLASEKEPSAQKFVWAGMSHELDWGNWRNLRG